MGSNISKIETICAPQGGVLKVDLKLDKEAGIFFADVGNERITAPTKVEAIKKTKEALSRASQTVWQEVIVIQVKKRRDDDNNDHPRSWYNDMPTFGASCVFNYFRRERAKDPLKSKQRIEREHTSDFERRVKHARTEVHAWTPEERRKRADEKEKALREQRASLGDVHHVFSHNDRETEYELPYSEEAWAGIELIAKTLRETQVRLDEFAKQASPILLAKLASGNVFGLLPAVGKKKS